MKQRLLTAIPLILVVALAIFFGDKCHGLPFLAFSLAMVLAGMYEAFTMVDIPCRKAFCSIAMAFAVVLVANAQLPALVPSLGLYMPYIDILIIACYALCTVAPVFHQGPGKEMCSAYLASLGIFLYIAWMLSFLGKLFFAPLGLVMSHFGRNLFLFIIAVTKMADVGAYVVGSLSAKMPGGNHKLAPRLSPKKSIEGLIGGTVFSVGTAFALAYIPNFICIQKATAGIELTRHFFYAGELLAIGVLASVIGLVGDLIESALKRGAGFKDSGHIPGIGGILDVLDSLIPISPLFYAYVLIKFNS